LIIVVHGVLVEPVAKRLLALVLLPRTPRRSTAAREVPRTSGSATPRIRPWAPPPTGP